MRLDRFYDLIISKTNLDTSLDVKSIHKFAKFLIKTSSKIYELKTYNKIIDNLIYKNKWRKVINKKL